MVGSLAAANNEIARPEKKSKIKLRFILYGGKNTRVNFIEK